MRMAIIGAARASAGLKERRPAVSRGMLQELFQHLDPGKSQDACILAMAAIAFWGQLRLGEVCASAAAGEKPATIPVWANVSEAFNAAGSRVLKLPWTKTKQECGEEVFFLKQVGIDNPISALENHLVVNHPAEEEALFTYRKEGKRLIMTRQQFLEVCNRIWASRGIPRITGHSFWIRGTTALLAAGVPPDVVKGMGRWSSDAFMCYWRQLENMAPRHAELLSTGGMQGQASHCAHR